MELWQMIIQILTGFIVVCSLTNLTNTLCMAHTWKHWRQVKWYVLMLMVGNWFELFFSMAVELRGHVAYEVSQSSATCKFLTMMSVLGPSLAGMAVAALAVHVLLTAITGSQGSGRRHGLVLGLFVALSLPVPLSRAAVFDYVERARYCVYTADEYYVVDAICTLISLVFFPILIWLSCIVPSAAVTLKKSKGNTKGEESLSDVVIVGILGLVFLVCSLPSAIFQLDMIGALFRGPDLNVWAGLDILHRSRNCISAIVIVVFAYVYAFRYGRDGSFTPTTETGERQKLVN